MSLGCQPAATPLRPIVAHRWAVALGATGFLAAKAAGFLLLVGLGTVEHLHPQASGVRVDQAALCAIQASMPLELWGIPRANPPCHRQLVTSPEWPSISAFRFQLSDY